MLLSLPVSEDRDGGTDEGRNAAFHETASDL